MPIPPVTEGREREDGAAVSETTARQGGSAGCERGRGCRSGAERRAGPGRAGRGRARGAGPAAHSRSAARSHSRISNFFTDGSPICSFRLRCARRNEEEEEDKAVDAMGQLCCFPFSRGEDKISKWQRCGLPPPRGAQSCGRAGLGVLLPLGTFTDCFLEKGRG